MTRVLTALLALAGLVLLAPLPAGACSCVARSVEEQAAAATVVFQGDVDRVEQNTATFDVNRVFKGSHAERLSVSTGDPASSCSVPVSPGRTYVVFAADRAGTLATDLCSGTTDDTSVGDRLAASIGTRPPSPADQGPGLPLAASSRRAPIGVAAGILAIVTVVYATSTLSRRRPRPVA
jgi:hypothetical protein